MPQGMTDGMMGGGWLWMVGISVFWILILALLVLAIVWLWQQIRKDGGARGGPPGP